MAHAPTRLTLLTFRKYRRWLFGKQNQKTKRYNYVPIWFHFTSLPQMDVDNDLQPVKVLLWEKKWQSIYLSSSALIKHKYFHSGHVWGGGLFVLFFVFKNASQPWLHDSIVALKALIGITAQHEERFWKQGHLMRAHRRLHAPWSNSFWLPSAFGPSPSFWLDLKGFK